MSVPETAVAAAGAAGAALSAVFPVAAPAIGTATAIAIAVIREADDAKLIEHVRAAIAEWKDGEHDTEHDIERGLDVILAVINTVPGIPDSTIDAIEEMPEQVAAEIMRLLRVAKGRRVSAAARRASWKLRHLRETRRVITAEAAGGAPLNPNLLPGELAARVEAARLAAAAVAPAPDGETSGPMPVGEPVLEIDDDTGEVPVSAPAPVVP